MVGSRIAFDLVIFDCDGVLVDSETVTNRVFISMLHDIGLPLTMEQVFEEFVGLSMEQGLEKIRRMRGRPAPDGFAEEYRRRSHEVLAAEVQPMPGVEEILVRIPVPTCVASSSDHARLSVMLTKTGLSSRFAGSVYSIADVGVPKPQPDVYLHAARSQGVSPDRCAVIEDTPTGVAAGLAAGMYVFGYAAHTPAHRLVAAGAHRVFSHMGELPGLLGFDPPPQ